MKFIEHLDRLALVTGWKGWDGMDWEWKNGMRWIRNERMGWDGLGLKGMDEMEYNWKGWYGVGLKGLDGME